MLQNFEEIAVLVDRVRELQPANVMEIGSNRGGTFYLWCRLAKLSGVKIAVDLPNGEFGDRQSETIEEIAERAERFESWAPNVHVVFGDSHNAKVQAKVRAMLGTRLLDFLFIDGDHTRAGVEQDWNDYRDLVRDGGLIAFHDVRDSEYHRVNGCFVHEFWKTLPPPKAEIIDRLSYWGGVGLITAGGKHAD